MSCQAQRSGEEHPGVSAPGGSSNLSVHLPLPNTGNQQGWSDCGLTSDSVIIQLCQVSLGGAFHVQ